MSLHQKSQHDRKKAKHKRQKKQLMKSQALKRVFWASQESIDESGKTRVFKMIKEWKFLNTNENDTILSVYSTTDIIPKEISSNTIVITKEGMVEMALFKSVLPPNLLEECTQLCREMSNWLAIEKNIEKGSFFSGWWTMNMPMGYKCADSYRFKLVDSKVKQIQAHLHDTFQHILKLANPKLFDKLSKLTEKGQTPVVCFNMIPARNKASIDKIENHQGMPEGKSDRPKKTHRDRNDMGISMMFYMGNFSGGSLQLVQVNEHSPETLIHVQAGDVVLLRANKYQHAVCPTYPQISHDSLSTSCCKEEKKIGEISSPHNMILSNPDDTSINCSNQNSPPINCPKQEYHESTHDERNINHLYENKRFSFIFFAHRTHFKHTREYSEMGQRQALNAFKADHPYYQSQRTRKKLEDCVDQSLILYEKRKPLKRNYALFNECGEDTTIIEDDEVENVQCRIKQESDSEEFDYETYEPQPTTEEYIIKAIIDHEKVFKGSDQSRKSYLYHIQWLGYPDETWEPFEHLDNCQVFEDYLMKHNINVYDDEEYDFFMMSLLEESNHLLLMDTSISSTSMDGDESNCHSITD